MVPRKEESINGLGIIANKEMKESVINIEKLCNKIIGIELV